MKLDYSSASFHKCYEPEPEKHEAYINSDTMALGSLKPDICKESSLGYLFRPHFHPYVDELIERLEKGSVNKLQAADTECPEGPLRVRSNTTKVRMEDGFTGTLPEGTDIRIVESNALMQVGHPLTLGLSIGTEIIVDDVSVEIKLPDGTGRTYERDAKGTLIGIERERALFDVEFFEETYAPTGLVATPYPLKEIDFASDGAYAVYNWELFYHAPLTIAIHLSRNQRFEDAQRWFHYIFDPTDDSDGPTPERFWKVKPFQYREVILIEKILESLHTETDSELRKQTEGCINEWAKRPFRPHLVARFRQTPYMFKAVMAYLDNLIAWGDSLFRQDTRESINEAMQIYVLAAKLLGERPQAIPKKGSVRPQTYNNLKEDLSILGNALVDIEAAFGWDITPPPIAGADRGAYLALRSIGHALYFCVPRNDKLIGYWDTVADRLFKIRNSLNIHGIFRQLPLFQPPIDPALLAKAAAAGLDVGAVVSGINQPLPLVRFLLLVQKALEICQEAKSLGNGLLAAIEKEDNEALAVLRAGHEQIILELTKTLKYGQWQEAIKAREGLGKSLSATVHRLTHYAKMLGRTDEEIAGLLKLPTDVTIDTFGLDTLDEDNLADETYEQGEAEFADIQGETVSYDIAPNETSISGENLAGGKKVNRHEMDELRNLESAHEEEKTALRLERVASLLSLIPQFDAEMEPMGVGAATGFGGVQLSTMMNFLASLARTESAEKSYEAARSAKIGTYQRREQEWAHQINLAAGEINQTIKQLRASQIREFVAKKDYKNQEKQIELSAEIQRFLKGEEIALGDKKHRKTTTQAFYVWLRREVKGLYGEYFQYAFDVAKKAERALQHELGEPSASFLTFGYLAGKEGLLAGEKLYLDIKRMEMAYHDQNRREYELTKHVSLQQIAPLALMQLRATGSCTLALPEALFDMDCPGHYFRRIKSVALSIPCVTGPYSSVNCTLTLCKSSIRKNAQLFENDRYGRTGSEDPRFSDHFGSMQSIITSSAQNDSGLFESNLNDERYLPFENSGVISEWGLELPANPSKSEPCQFDYNTISDVILHIRYTAREGGKPLRTSALTHLSQLIDKAEAAGSTRLFSVRHEFSSAWALFKGIEMGAETFAPLTIELREEHYPFWAKGHLEAVVKVEILAKTTDGIDIFEDIDENGAGTGRSDSLSQKHLGNLYGSEIDILPASPIGPYTLYFSSNEIEDLWLALTFGKTE